MKRLVPVAMLVVVGYLLAGRISASAAPDRPTFTRDVAPILHARCITCHRAGEVAPMALRTYEEARPWARSIKNKVVSRQMPPWMAEPGVGVFANDPRLTDAEIATIAQWVDEGAVQGDPKDMPKLPEFTEGWQLGEPDQIIELPEVQIPATGGDVFPTPTVTPDLKEDRWIRAIEIRPSARQVAHHSVIFATNAMGLLGGNTSGFFDVLGVWAVGTPATIYPEGSGRWVRKGQALRTNLHYHPNGTAQTDRTRIGLYFGKGELKKEVVAALAGNVTFSIPPNAPNFELRGVYVVDQDISVVSLFPHMHLRGKDMKMTATYPNGKQETLLNVPAYDFSWQLFYYPKTRIKLPKGTRVDLVAHYDNSAANKNNPDPTKAVTFGEASTSEMMFGMFEFTADAGVSPTPSTPRARMEALVATLPKESSFLLDLPFTTPPQPAVLYVPRTGDAGFYTQAGGVILPQPVPKLVWDGNYFQFNTLLRVFGGGGGFYTVSGTIAGDGTVRGTFQRLGARGSGPQPSFEYTGKHRP
jgi:mono/diheme cytochrome c family protein